MLINTNMETCSEASQGPGGILLHSYKKMACQSQSYTLHEFMLDQKFKTGPPVHNPRSTKLGTGCQFLIIEPFLKIFIHVNKYNE
jgi:hypothetical protein